MASAQLGRLFVPDWPRLLRAVGARFLVDLAGGMLADKADRRHVITLFQAIQMMCPVAPVMLIHAHLVEPWMVVGLSLIVDITDARSMPSFLTIAPSIVKHDQIGSAIALNATQFNLSRILDPALGGLLQASVGAVGCFVVNAASYLPFIAVALWILPPGMPDTGSDEPLDRHRLVLGLRRIAASDYMRGALITVLVTSMLSGPLIVSCPVLVKDVLHGDSIQFSLAIGGFGMGVLLGAIAMLGVDPGYSVRRLSSGFAAAYGATAALAAVNPWISALPLILAIAGFCIAISNTAVDTLLQAAAPARLRGRTISLYMLAMRGGLSLGSLLVGMSAEIVGARYALLLSGTLALATHAMLGRRWLRAGLPLAAEHPQPHNSKD